MASKRKRSRPTRIAKADDVDTESLPGIASYDEETLSRIQRYIEEGSEDTPDCLERKLEQCQTTDNVLFTEHENDFVDSPPMPENSNTGEKVFPESHMNGHIPVPSNLKFHQLLKDEVESLKRVTEAQELMSFQESEKKQCASKNKNMNEECSTRKDADRLLSFKQVVAASKRAFGKRSKPSDDETPRYSCTMCKYVTNRSDHYKRHLMTHSADKPLKCTMCSYGTGRSDHYKRHLQRHGLSEHEIIETCFRNGLKLKNAAPSVSQVVTIDEHANKLKENVVEKSVKQESKPVVRGEKKHKCNQCSYSTDKSSHLKRHQLSHSKSTTSYCSKCNRTYKTPNYINNHKCFRTYGHRCPKCVQIFPDHAAMLRHIVDKHRNDQVLLSATKPVLKNITTDRQITDEKGTKVLTKSTTVITTVEEDIDNPSSKSKPPLTTDDQKPIDLSLVVPKREIVDAVKSFVQQEESDAISKKVLDDQSDIFVSNVPSNGGNMGCTKCGGWFNKLTEYSTHSCVS